jgi:hypothetical protein
VGSSNGKISLTVPLPNDVNPGSLEKGSMIGFGFSNTASTNYNFRLQSMISPSGSPSPLLIASAPLQVTLVQYSSDIRIKTDIEGVDEEALLQRMKRVQVRSYRYTDEWRSVRDDIPDVRVRGVIAQELAEVFPEYVSIIPEYTLSDKHFAIKDFHQVDKTSLIIDLIAAIQAQSKRFSVSENSITKTGDIKIGSSSWMDAIDAVDNTSSGAILIESGDARGGVTGDIRIATGSSEMSAAGSIDISAGTSGSGKGAIIGLEAGQGRRRFWVS